MHGIVTLKYYMFFVALNFEVHDGKRKICMFLSMNHCKPCPSFKQNASKTTVCLVSNTAIFF